MRKFLCSLLICFVPLSLLNAQGQSFNLELALQYLTNTHEYYEVQADLEQQSLSHKIFRANVLPQVNLSATLPDFDRSISMVLQSDGSYSFQNHIYATSNLSLSVKQLIPCTGGYLYLNTSLSRLDNLSVGNKFHSYNYNIGKLSYKQALWSFNEYKWLKVKDLMERKYERIQYHIQIEKIRYSLVESFFSLLCAQQKDDLNNLKMRLSSYVYEKTKELYAQGRVSKASLLEVEIDFLKEKSKEFNVLELKTMQEKFCSLLQIPDTIVPFADFRNDTTRIRCVGNQIPFIVNRALEYYVEMSQEIEIYEREMKFKQNEYLSKPEIGLNLGVGLNSKFKNISNAYDNNMNSELVSITLSIPLFDGGIAKNRTKISKLQLERAITNNLNNREKTINIYTNELLRMDFLASAIKNYSRIINLLYEELDMIKMQVDQGRLNFEQYIRLKASLEQSNSEYYSFIKEYYLLAYKYRYVALYDVFDQLPITI